MSVDGDVGRSLLEVRRLHPTHPEPLRRIGHVGPDLGPRISPVPCEVDPAVVGSDPDQASPNRRLGQSDDGGMGFGTGDIPGEASTLGVGQVRIVGGKIRADDLPTVAPIEALEEPVSSEQNGVAVVGREAERR